LGDGARPRQYERGRRLRRAGLGRLVARAPRLSRWMLVYTLLAGLLFGLYFSLIGLGLNLIFGVMRVVNLAHGDFLMLGAFAAYWLFQLAGLGPIASLGLVFLAFALLGLPLYYVLVPRLLAARDPAMLSTLLFFA